MASEISPFHKASSAASRAWPHSKGDPDQSGWWGYKSKHNHSTFEDAIYGFKQVDSYCGNRLHFLRGTDESTAMLFSMAIGRGNASQEMDSLVDHIYLATPSMARTHQVVSVGRPSANLDFSAEYLRFGRYLRVIIAAFLVVAPAIFAFMSFLTIAAATAYLSDSLFVAFFFGVLAVLFGALALYVYLFQRKVGLSWQHLSKGSSMQEWTSLNRSSI